MNYKMVGRLGSFILLFEAFFMVPSAVLCFADGDRRGGLAFLITIGIVLVLFGALALLSIGAKKGFYAREGLVTVGLGWVVLSLTGSLPFCISGQIPDFIDALFETVSGFTTTGATIVTDYARLSRGMFYWRSFTHWIGGMGVLVFLLAVIPLSGKNEGFAMHILRAESPGPDVGKLVPKMRRTAAILYAVYIVLTVVTIAAYAICGMPFFEAVCHGFGTAGTGGYGVLADSFAGYSPAIQVAAAVCMILFGINFNCYFLLIMGKIRGVALDEELRFFLGTVLVSTAMITINVRSLYATFGETLRHSFFQVSSIVTTTGFSTVDFDAWPAFSKVILLILMITGACAGSTGGGLKCARVLILLKGIKRNVSQVLRPRRVQSLRISGKAVDERVISNTNAYFAAYMAIIGLSFLLISVDGFSVTTNISAVLACFNNIGPGLDAVGPSLSYASYGVFSKIVLILDMLAGRLEIFPILVLFAPATWKRR